MVTAGNGVMVVRPLPDAEAVSAFAPRLVALVRHGLDGDRDGVRAVALRLRADLAKADRPELAQRIDEVLADADRRRAGGGRPDVLVTLHRLGSLDDDQLAAGLEIRRAVELAYAERHGACAVMDPTKPIVDGGWFAEHTAGSGGFGYALSPAFRRVARWVRALQGQRVKGKAAHAGAADVALRVVVLGEPAGEVDASLRCRKGTAARVTVAALGLYVAMHRATTS